MTDEINKKKEDIMKFALEELKKTMNSLKQGKAPADPQDLKKMLQILKEGYDMMEQNKISEEEMNVVLSEAAKKANKDK